MRIKSGYNFISSDFESNQLAMKSLDTEIKGLLKDRKLFKFMSKQDKLMALCALKSWEQAKIEEDQDLSRVGIYLCVGILPFDEAPLEKLCVKSITDNKFDIKVFSDLAYNSMNPLLTFKCLPNMALFHTSYNLGVTGRYFMTYSGVSDWVQCLQKGIKDLEDGIIDYAIVGSACDQDNFLVRQFYQRLGHDLNKDPIDSASVMILRRDDLGLQIKDVIESYRPVDIGNKISEIQGKTLELPLGCSQISLEIVTKLESAKENHCETIDHHTDFGTSISIELGGAQHE
ncbi:MAG: hypothetical protein HOE90_01660 [Bacteriovoracaceae bacterium]|jgi:hypothetical protein|nr:hypothetical protein [Bacteriovoracaceae bacterium]